MAGVLGSRRGVAGHGPLHRAWGAGHVRTLSFRLSQMEF